MNILQAIISIVAKPIADVLTAREERKAKQKELEDAAHERTVEGVKHATDVEQAWNLAQIKNSSWKDEWFTLILSMPLVGAFIPPAVPYIMAGFDVLEKMPDYYKVWVGTAIAAAFGFQQVAKAWKWWHTP